MNPIPDSHAITLKQTNKQYQNMLRDEKEINDQRKKPENQNTRPNTKSIDDFDRAISHEVKNHHILQRIPVKQRTNNLKGITIGDK